MQNRELYKNILNKVLLNNKIIIFLLDKNKNIIYCNNNNSEILEFINSDKDKIKIQDNVFIKKKEKIINDNQEYNLIIVKEQELNYNDSVTGLPNRETVDRYLNELDLTVNENLYIVISDIDYFKRVNDTIGHIKADFILRIISNYIKSSIESDDFVGRYGGEEFIFVINANNEEEILKKVEKIRKGIEELIFHFYKYANVTMSFGVCKYNRNEKILELIERADQALYQSKNDGRNSISVYNNQKKIKKYK